MTGQSVGITDMLICAEPAEELRLRIKIALINLASNKIKSINGLINLTGMQELALIVLITHVKQPQPAILGEKHSHAGNSPFINVLNKQLIIAQLQAVLGKGTAVSGLVVNDHQITILILQDNVTDS